MFRLVLMLALMGVLAGCQQPASPAGAAQEQAEIYQCTSTDDGAAPTALATSRRLTVFNDTADQQALISVDGGEVNYLNLVPGETHGLYSNAKYAWKSDGKTNQFTDIANVQVYSCTPDADAAPVKP